MSQIEEALKANSPKVTELSPPSWLTATLTPQQAIAYALQYLRRDLVIKYLTAAGITPVDAEKQYQACMRLIDETPLISQTLEAEWSDRIGETWQDDLKRGKTDLVGHWNEGVCNAFAEVGQKAKDEIYARNRGKTAELPEWSQEQLIELDHALDFVPGYFRTVNFHKALPIASQPIPLPTSP